MSGFQTVRNPAGQQPSVCPPCGPAALPELPIRKVEAFEIKGLVSQETFDRLGKPGVLDGLIANNPEHAQTFRDIKTLQENGLKYNQVFSQRTDYFLRQESTSSSRVIYRFSQDDNKEVVGTIAGGKNLYASDADKQLLKTLAQRDEAAQRIAQQQPPAAGAQVTPQRQEEAPRQSSQPAVLPQPTPGQRYEAFLENLKVGERYRASDKQFERGLGREYARIEGEIKRDTQKFLVEHNVNSFSELSERDQSTLVRQLKRSYAEDFSNCQTIYDIHATNLEAVDLKQHGAERDRLARQLQVAPDQLDTVAQAIHALREDKATGRSVSTDSVIEKIRTRSEDFLALPAETQELLHKVMTLENPKHFAFYANQYFNKLGAPQYERMRDNVCRALNIPSDRASLDEIAACIVDAREKRDALYSFMRSQGIESPERKTKEALVLELGLKGGPEALIEATRLYKAIEDTICDLPEATRESIGKIMSEGDPSQVLTFIVLDSDARGVGNSYVRDHLVYAVEHNIRTSPRDASSPRFTRQERSDMRRFVESGSPGPEDA